MSYVPITSDLLHAPDLRVPIASAVENGLRLDSQVMVDMIQTSSLAKFGQVIGHVDALTLIRVERSRRPVDAPWSGGWAGNGELDRLPSNVG